VRGSSEADLYVRSLLVRPSRVWEVFAERLPTGCPWAQMTSRLSEALQTIGCTAAGSVRDCRRIWDHELDDDVRHHGVAYATAEHVVSGLDDLVSTRQNVGRCVDWTLTRSLIFA